MSLRVQKRYVAGRPNKCRPRQAVSQPSEATGAGSLHVRAEFSRPLRQQHHAQLQWLQRDGEQRGRRSQALLQLSRRSLDIISVQSIR